MRYLLLLLLALHNDSRQYPRSFSRSLNGALNGNIGVMKSMMIEITDSTNLAQAYAYMPIAWCSGSTLGSVLYRNRLESCSFGCISYP